MNSSPLKSDETVGVAMIGIVVGVPLLAEAVAVGGMTYPATSLEATKDSWSIREPRRGLFPKAGRRS